MSKKAAPPPKLTALLLRRGVASAYYLSGQVDRFRETAVENGDMPWRIIRYQRVLDPDQIAYPIVSKSFVLPQTLESHLKYIKRRCNPISLDELMKRVEQNDKLPPKTVVVTFDGGWIDTHRFAFPLLQRYQIPATVFAATAFLGTDNIWWTDKVLFAMLMLKEKGIPFPQFSFLDDQFYHWYNIVSSGKEIQFENIALLIDRLKIVSPEDRFVALNVLGQLVEKMGGLPNERMFMNWNEVREMAKSLVTFGSLGHNHANFVELSNEKIAVELRESYTKFKAEQIEPTKVICFPFGDATKEIRALIASLGVTRAVANTPLPRPNIKSKLCAVFGRTDIYQAAAFCPEIFACRLWNIKALGYTY